MDEGRIQSDTRDDRRGFGGKTTVYLETGGGRFALLKKSGRQVKMVMTRADVLRASGPTSGTKISSSESAQSARAS